MRSEPMEEAPKRKPQRIVRQGPLDGLYGLYVMCVCVCSFFQILTRGSSQQRTVVFSVCDTQWLPFDRVHPCQTSVRPCVTPSLSLSPNLGC